MFVADVLYSNIYDFKLNQSRTGLLLNGTLDDKVANTPAEDQPLIFAHGFGGITDIQVGPDGYLYVLSYTGGAIYRIVPSS
jgi:glucose/arabinose dehydrogenase